MSSIPVPPEVLSLAHDFYLYCAVHDQLTTRTSHRQNQSAINMVVEKLKVLQAALSAAHITETPVPPRYVLVGVRSFLMYQAHIPLIPTHNRVEVDNVLSLLPRG
jgi:hypothetical protein